MNLHIVTGASRGLGLALAEILTTAGDHVVDLSRSGRATAPNFRSYPCDLSSPESKEPLLKRVLADHPLDRYQRITLTNNAGMVDPIRPLERLSESEIAKNVFVNLTAPMILTSAFLRLTSSFKGERVIANVTSGVAKFPKASWAPYSISKAGIDAFTEVLAKEYEGQSGVRVVNFEPGIIDTEMQALIRHTSEADFAERDRFVAFKNEGQLQPPAKVAGILAQFLRDPELPAKTFTSIYDHI